MAGLTRRRPIRASFAAAFAAALGLAQQALATPSTQIWIPSPDIQKFGTLHLNSDVYARPERSPILMLGPTVGVLPFEKLQAEVGFDLVFQGNKDLDNNPLYFNGKVAVPEDAFFHWQPAVAFGIYNVGTRRSEELNTMQNVGYVLVGRTLPYLGRLSAGYYLGNAAALRAPLANDPSVTRADNHGLLLSWDRTMKEISENLWLGVDFQQGDNALGAINAGLGWSFSKEVGVIVGYDHYWNEATAGKDTFTVQLDVNLFLPKEKAAENPEGGAPAPKEKPEDGISRVPVPAQHAEGDEKDQPADRAAKDAPPAPAGEAGGEGERGAKPAAEPASDAPADDGRK